MSSSGDLHLVREDNAWVAAWTPFVLRSAFQPLYGLQGGRLSIVAFEALLRPFRDNTPIPPLIFLRDLDAADRVLVENLLHRLHLLNAAAFLPAEAQIFVNLDPSVFLDHAVADEAIHRMRVTLSETGIGPHRVVCEITEKRAVSQDVLFSIATLLRASGFRIAVDDFGAENSDMGRIRDLHPDIVKFDADWIARMIGTSPGLALLTKMVESFEGQGIRTVFEGIENSWQIELAEKAGVSMMQGFALAQPEIVPGSFLFRDQADAPAVSGGPAQDATPPDAPKGPHQPKSFGRRTRPA